MVSSLSAWRRAPSIVLIAILLSLLSATPPSVRGAPTELLVNRSWELNNVPDSSWTNARVDPTEAGNLPYSGTYVNQMYSNTIYQDFTGGAVSSNGNFTIDFWVWRASGSNLFGWVYLYYNDTGLYYWETYEFYFTANPVAWEHFTVTFTGGVDLDPDRFIQGLAFGGTTNNYYYVDLVSCQYDAPPDPYPFGIGGGGLLDGDAGGNWVFVSPKTYTFYADYEGNATIFGLYFEDQGVNAFEWYNDEVTPTYNYITSYKQGVSGAFIGHSALNATHSRATWKLKFNLPIADTLNATAEIWIEDENANYSGITFNFNIYNLGGFSTITASGWAGRLTDLDTGETIGDAFEIYSADSRTPFMIDAEKFGSDQTFGLFEWTRDPVKDFPQWEFIQTGANAYTELKRDHIDEDLPPYPFFPAIGVNGAPSSLHLQSDDVTNYLTRASIQFRRRVTNEIVNASVWILVHTTDTNAKIRLADEDLHFTSGNEGASFEVKGDVMGYRDGSGNYIEILTHDLDTWYKVLMSVDLTNGLQCVEIYDQSLTILNSTGYVPMYQDTNELEYWNIISADGGGLGACDIFADELEIHSDFSGLYGGQVKSSMIFNQLQLWRQDFDFSIEEGSEYTKATYADYGFIELGVDYMIKGAWVNNALWARMNVTDSNISGKNNWVKYTVNWFEDDTLIRDDEIYGLFYGHSGADIGDARKDATGFHWSTWFNRANASTVIGARINPEFFGMSDKSPWWNILSSDWKPMLGDVDESTVYRRVVDQYGDPATVKDIELVRVWERCYRTNQSTFHYSIQNIREQNFQVSPNTMEGIDTPAIVKTMMPTMQGGFLGSALGAIFRGIIGKLGDSLLWGGMQVWTSFFLMIDTIASYMGAQGWFTYVLASIRAGAESVTTASGWILTINGWIWSSILYVMSWFSSIAFWLNLYSSMAWNFWGMLTGTYITTTDTVTDLNLPAFIMLFLIALPLLILDRMGTNGVFPVIHEIQTVVGWGGWIYSYLAGLIAGFVDLVFQLIEAIPVVE